METIQEHLETKLKGKVTVRVAAVHWYIVVVKLTVWYKCLSTVLNSTMSLLLKTLSIIVCEYIIKQTLLFSFRTFIQVSIVIICPLRVI